MYSVDRPSFEVPAGWQTLLRECTALGWLILASGAVYILLVQGTSQVLSPQQEAVLRLFVLPSVPLAGLVFLLRAREITEAFIRLPFLILFLALIWSSIAWSLDPAITFRRALSVTAFTVLAVWLALAFEPAALLRRLAWLMLLILILSAVFAVLLPGLAFHTLQDVSLLRGVFTHKNMMGQQLGFAAILLAIAWQFRLIPRLAAGIGLALCLGLAWPTGSATTIIILIALAGIRVAATLLLLPARVAVAVACFAVAATAFSILAALFWAESVFAALGRDLTFTGRVPLWEFVWLQISQRPWLGYGFAAFFTIPWVRAYTVETLNWEIPNAHNGYLDLWLGVGIAGPIFITIFLSTALFSAITSLKRGATPGSIFSLYFIPIYMLRNLVEGDLAAPSQFSWVLAVIASTMTLRAEAPTANSRIS